MSRKNRIALVLAGRRGDCDPPIKFNVQSVDKTDKKSNLRDIENAVLYDKNIPSVYEKMEQIQKRKDKK